VNKKLRYTIPLAMVGIVSLAACSSGAASSTDEATVSFAHMLAESQPWHECGALEFQDYVESADSGLTVDLFPAGQTQASTLEQLDAIDAGNLDITWATPAQLATRLEALSVFDAAYLFRDSDHLAATMESPVAQELWDELRDEDGMRVIGAGYYGTRHVTSNIPVHTPDDLDGVKMRVLDAPLWLDNGAALGATPTPVPFSELYLALQQGVVDAEENPLPVIEAQSFDEVQEYVNLTGHTVAMMAVVISEDTWQELNAAQQDTLVEAGQVLGDGVTSCTLEQEAALLETWSAADSEFTVNADVDLDAFRANVEDTLLPKYEDVWGDTYRAIQEIK